MKYYNSVLDLIGKTPLVKISKLTNGIKAKVFAKLESFNPGGSVKDRIGLAIIEKAERDGILKTGSTIVEATSGNTGIGLALAATLKGYKTIIVVTDKTSLEKRNYLKALGAEVIVVPKTASTDSDEYYINKAKTIAASIPDSFFASQYTNPANPEVHYLTTGPEIWEATDGNITHFIAGIGTGGTITGVAKFLKEKNSNIKVIAADPVGSIAKVYKQTHNLHPSSSYLVEGIGLDVIPEIVNFDLIDEIVEVEDIDSIRMCRLLSQKEGIFCGASSGTIAKVAIDIATNLDENSIVVFMVCDTGERYLTKYHNEEWLKSHLPNYEI